ncbi:YqjF family protein [Aureibacter tunicatorum]|uniref:DUF2071 domain-containing protein n=1 Tax=Aureibacter tunicatorum TaxID=866807 RepID=A0AAE3XQA5_9BACT|nr:DUF2071 domain-containing protein [Aureibacter tunicatorum]MDR6240650.1 hypothetical protein [Aureibacter tunicatorum]BDD06489.1 hypothetical protein AUTU_39720 [Aureibacter tunicatorum]
MSFLKAEWRKLAIFNYEIDSEVLKEYVPYGTELDLWNGKCYVSLIGFMFLNTRLLGVKIPFHTNFEEVNLRFYVKRFEDGEWKRGVVFVKEIVPKPALTFVANTVYNENYETLPMRHNWQEDLEHRKVAYQWRKDGEWNSIAIVADKVAKEIEVGSETEFITEHYWGYAKVNEKATNSYEVTHPRWKAYEVLEHKISVDFKATYGDKFAFLSELKPASVMLAEGSNITVEPKTKLR